MAWWIAAQILRTKRQRERINFKIDADAVEPPPNVSKYARNNPHLGFITSQLNPLATLLYRKPWGIGFSDTCLPTGDVPIIIMNGQDDEDQLLAAAFWDVIVPLDPHRFLMMPGPDSQHDPATKTDHRLQLPGGLGIFVTDEIFAAAESHVFHHPDHKPYSWDQGDKFHGPRLPRPWAGDTWQPPQSILEYQALPPYVTVERRWLTEHPPAKTEQPVPGQPP